MRISKIPVRILLFLLFAILFLFSVSAYHRYQEIQAIKNNNSNISIWHKERDEVYNMEDVKFAGTVQSKSPGHHRGAIDTLTLKLNLWACVDISFSGDYYLKRMNDSLLLLFVS